MPQKDAKLMVDPDGIARSILRVMPPEMYAATKTVTVRVQHDQSAPPIELRLTMQYGLNEFVLAYRINQDTVLALVEYGPRTCEIIYTGIITKMQRMIDLSRDDGPFEIAHPPARIIKSYS